MKKPSRSFCSVCPKNLGQGNSSEEPDDPSLPKTHIVRKPKKRNLNNRNGKRITFTHSSTSVMKRIEAINRNNSPQNKPRRPVQRRKQLQRQNDMSGMYEGDKGVINILLTRERVREVKRE